MLLDYMQQECEMQERVVVENSDWLVVVPYWAKWPFETLLLPKFSCPKWHDVTPDKSNTLADILQKLTRGYDNLFQCSFPYSMGWHCAPPQQKITKHGSCMRIFIHHFCAVRALKNSWWALRCWQKPSVISRLNKQPSS